MAKSFLCSAAFSILFTFQASVSAESYLYTYSGRNYDTFINTLFSSSMGISGHIETDAPLDPNLTLVSISPVSYRFTNGVATLTETTSTSSDVIVSTDAAGNIIDWSFSITEGNPAELVVGDKIHTISTAPDSEFTFYSELIAIDEYDTKFFSIIAGAYSTVQAGTWEIYRIRPIEIASNNNSDSAIKLTKDKFIKVAILGDSGFDALQVDIGSVKFGPTGLEASPIRSKAYDYDSDGFTDIILTFELDDTGITCGDTEAILTGKTYGNPEIIIKGTDTISVDCQ